MDVIRGMYSNRTIVNFKTAKNSIESLKDNKLDKLGKQFSTIHKLTAKKQAKKQVKREDDITKLNDTVSTMVEITHKRFNIPYIKTRNMEKISPSFEVKFKTIITDLDTACNTAIPYINATIKEHMNVKNILKFR